MDGSISYETKMATYGKSGFGRKIRKGHESINSLRWFINSKGVHTNRTNNPTLKFDPTEKLEQGCVFTACGRHQATATDLIGSEWTLENHPRLGIWGGIAEECSRCFGAHGMDEK